MTAWHPKKAVPEDWGEPMMSSLKRDPMAWEGAIRNHIEDLYWPEQEQHRRRRGQVKGKGREGKA